MPDKIIFADVDGILNCCELDVTVGCGPIHADKIDILNQILVRTGAKIVLSSAWRYLVIRGEMTLVGLDWLFKSHGLLKDRLIGITNPDMSRANEHWDGKPNSWIPTNERGEQITAYVKEHGIKRYVVLDDLDLGITLEGHPFVKTDSNKGLKHYHLAEIVSILNAN